MKMARIYTGHYNKRLTGKVDTALDDLTTEVDIAIATNEIYQICAYDKRLSKRLKNTLEENAYNVVVSQLHYALLLTLVRIWDDHPASSTSLPRVIEMLSRDDVQNAIYNRRYFWASDPSHRKVTTFDQSDPEKLKLIEEMWRASLPGRGVDAANDARTRIRRCLRMSNHKSLERLKKSLRTFRNKAIAHMPNRRSPIWRSGEIVPLRNGDEKAILERTLRITAELNSAVRSLGFHYGDTRKIWRGYSKAFWNRI